MDKLRYPIGQFDPIDQPNAEQLTGWIQELIELLNSRFVRLLITLNIDDFQRTFISPTLGELTLNIAI
jgi:hypothetical protein